MDRDGKAAIAVLILIVGILAIMALLLTPKPTGPLCPQNSPNRSSVKDTVCGNYTLIAPAGLQAMGGNVVVYQQNGYWNPNGCAYSITSLIPPKGTKNMTLSVYNTSKVFVMILDIPAYLNNGTGRHLQYLEYDIRCG